MSGWGFHAYLLFYHPMHIFYFTLSLRWDISTKVYKLDQVYGYSRRFAEIGIAEVLVSALRKQVAPSSLPSACAALKSIAVNVSFAMVFFFFLFNSHLHLTRNKYLLKAFTLASWNLVQIWKICTLYNKLPDTIISIHEGAMFIKQN